MRFDIKTYKVMLWTHCVISVEATNREDAIAKATDVWGNWPTPGADDVQLDHAEISGVLRKEE